MNHLAGHRRRPRRAIGGQLVKGAERALAGERRHRERGVYPNSPVLEMTVDEWDRVLETNARGVFLTCQAVGRSMVANGTRGKIVTISPGAYSSGRKGAAHYCASKAGVVMFTKVLAMELAAHRDQRQLHRARPGHGGSRPGAGVRGVRADMVRNVPWSRQGTPTDIAHAALYPDRPFAGHHRRGAHGRRRQRERPHLAAVQRQDAQG